MKINCIILLLVVSSYMFAQTNIDSLEQALLNDPESVTLLNELSSAYWKISPEKGIDYANRANVIAKNSNDKLGIAKSLQNIGLNHWYQ